LAPLAIAHVPPTQHPCGSKAYNAVITGMFLVFWDFVVYPEKSSSAFSILYLNFLTGVPIILAERGNGNEN
jgi:hypothetical protein